MIIVKPAPTDALVNHLYPLNTLLQNSPRKPHPLVGEAVDSRISQARLEWQWR